MKPWIALLALVLFLSADTASPQDRTGAISQMRQLSAIPGSDQPTVLPPDERPWIVFIFKACCSPADQAAHWILKAQERYGDKVGIVGLNVDRTRTLQRVPGWLNSHKINFPVLNDPTGEVARSWGVILPPTVVLLDTAAIEVYRTMGFEQSCEEKLVTILDLQLSVLK